MDELERSFAMISALVKDNAADPWLWALAIAALVSPLVYKLVGRPMMRRLNMKLIDDILGGLDAEQKKLRKIHAYMVGRTREYKHVFQGPFDSEFLAEFHQLCIAVDDRIGAAEAKVAIGMGDLRALARHPERRELALGLTSAARRLASEALLRFTEASALLEEQDKQLGDVRSKTAFHLSELDVNQLKAFAELGKAAALNNVGGSISRVKEIGETLERARALFEESHSLSRKAADLMGREDLVTICEALDVDLANVGGVSLGDMLAKSRDRHQLYEDRKAAAVGGGAAAPRVPGRPKPRCGDAPAESLAESMAVLEERKRELIEQGVDEAQFNKLRRRLDLHEAKGLDYEQEVRALIAFAYIANQAYVSGRQSWTRALDDFLTPIVAEPYHKQIGLDRHRPSARETALFARAQEAFEQRGKILAVMARRLAILKARGLDPRALAHDYWRRIAKDGFPPGGPTPLEVKHLALSQLMLLRFVDRTLHLGLAEQVEQAYDRAALRFEEQRQSRQAALQTRPAAGDDPAQARLAEEEKRSAALDKLRDAWL